MKKPPMSKHGSKEWMTWMRSRRKQAAINKARKKTTSAGRLEKKVRKAQKKRKVATKTKKVYRRRKTTLNLKKGITGAVAGMAMPGVIGYGIGYYLGGVSGVLGALFAPSIAPMLEGASGGIAAVSGIKIHR